MQFSGECNTPVIRLSTQYKYDKKVTQETDSVYYIIVPKTYTRKYWFTYIECTHSDSRAYMRSWRSPNNVQPTMANEKVICPGARGPDVVQGVYVSVILWKQTCNWFLFEYGHIALKVCAITVILIWYLALSSNTCNSSEMVSFGFKWLTSSAVNHPVPVRHWVLSELKCQTPQPCNLCNFGLLLYRFGFRYAICALETYAKINVTMTHARPNVHS